MPCSGSTSTIYPLIIEEVESTASLALLHPLLFQFSIKVAWSPRPIHVLVPGEDHTWSLKHVRAPIPNEGRTWSLMPIRVPVPVPVEDRMVAHARGCSDSW